MGGIKGKKETKPTADENNKDRADLELGIVAGVSVLIAKGADAPLTRVIRALCNVSTKGGLERVDGLLRQEEERLEKIERAAKLKRNPPQPKEKAPAPKTVPNEDQQYKVDYKTYREQDIQGYS